MTENKSQLPCGCCGHVDNEAVAALFQQACAIEKKADSGSAVGELIDALKRVVAADPGNYEALWRIGNYHILMGAAYAANKKEKKFHYMQAVDYCVKAMCVNDCFKQKTDDGHKIWEAVDQLGAGYIDAMGYWYTARFYYFKECLSVIGRIFNLQIPIKNNLVIERIDALDPNWAGGGNFMSRAIYFIALPKRYGGSKERAAGEFQKAIDVGPDYLVNRWGRAKYLYSLTGNKEGYIDDLNWVLEQDPHTAPNTYPWNVYFQRQAKEMLLQAAAVFG
jgi:tetratricopeptide (TPR) repeat protein